MSTSVIQRKAKKINETNVDICLTFFPKRMSTSAIQKKKKN